NGDGKQDLVTANFTGENVGVLLGNGDGTFRNADTLGRGFLRLEVAVGDFNGDGLQDVAVANLRRSVSVLLGNGDGSFRDAGTFGTGSGTGFVAVADFDGDGRQDLVVENADIGTVSVLLNSTDRLALAGPASATYGDQVTYQATLDFARGPGGPANGTLHLIVDNVEAAPHAVTAARISNRVESISFSVS